MEARARALLARLTPAEKIAMLSGGLDFYAGAANLAGSGRERRPVPAAAVPRLGLDGLSFADGPRGIAVGTSTCFPVPIARAATFDYGLEEQVGDAMGREARAHGANIVAAPCINLLRHPGWGRAQETYGDDPTHVGEMGAALTRGLQKHVMACAKHFACNSIENTRFRLDVRVDLDVLDTVYLPHFERVVREGVASVMSAYNSVNGEWCSENYYLLTTVLKERWGFDGFVMSDFVFALHDGPKAVNAGLDLEMPSPLFLGKHLERAVQRGLVPWERVDDAALRLIRQQLRFAPPGAAADAVGAPGLGVAAAGSTPAAGGAAMGGAAAMGNAAADPGYGPEVIACAAHRALAREVATRAIVLLRNEPVDGKPLLPLLPLSAGPAAGPAGEGPAPRLADGAAAQLRRVAVIGRLAAVPNTGDHGSSDVVAPYVVTPLEGLRAALEPLGVEVIHDPGDDPARAARLAAEADTALVVVGYDYHDEGELIAAPLPDGFLRNIPRPPLKSLPGVVAKAAKAAWGMVAARLLGRGGLAGGGDRKCLTLRPADENLLLAAAAANPKTVAVLMCGSAVLMERWRQAVPAVLILWYPGMEGGHALADVVLGRRSPTGRLPFTIPTSAEHLPFFDPDATVIEYGPLHGQPLLDHLGVPAAYPFGFGLSYSG